MIFFHSFFFSFVNRITHGQMPSQFGMIERTLDHIRPLYIICNLINVQVRFFFNKHIWRCGDPRQTAINMHKMKNHQTLSCKPLKAGVNMCTFRDEWMKILLNQNDITLFQAGASDLTDRHYPIGQWTGHVTEWVRKTRNLDHASPTTSCLRFRVYVRV